MISSNVSDHLCMRLLMAPRISVCPWEQILSVWDLWMSWPHFIFQYLCLFISFFLHHNLPCTHQVYKIIYKCSADALEINNSVLRTYPLVSYDFTFYSVFCYISWNVSQTFSDLIMKKVSEQQMCVTDVVYLHDVPGIETKCRCTARCHIK